MFFFFKISDFNIQTKFKWVYLLFLTREKRDFCSDKYTNITEKNLFSLLKYMSQVGEVPLKNNHSGTLCPSLTCILQV